MAGGTRRGIERAVSFNNVLFLNWIKYYRNWTGHINLLGHICLHQPQVSPIVLGKYSTKWGKVRYFKYWIGNWEKIRWKRRKERKDREKNYRSSFLLFKYHRSSIKWVGGWKDFFEGRGEIYQFRWKKTPLESLEYSLPRARVHTEEPQVCRRRRPRQPGRQTQERERTVWIHS